MNNDVRIIGLNMHTVLIEDISMDVPHGVTVDIPADKAAKSKDLWRLISQKQLFRLNPGGPLADYPQPSPPSNLESERLREENRLLAEKNRLHEEENRLLRAMVESQGGKLDSILGFLESARFGGNGVGLAAPVVRASEVVDAGVPAYIPAEIKPKNVESHVEVQSETSEGTSIAGAGEALRKLRRGTR